VALFFLLSGYVCSIKPLRLARAGKYEEAWSCIASSAFRRVMRLFIPATLATFVAFVFAQCGAFELAHGIHAEYHWLQSCSALPTEGTWASIKNLIDHTVSPAVERLTVVCDMAWTTW
jgi:peptidoglycan/LPS O-acetylase OafA/YrhL